MQSGWQWANFGAAGGHSVVPSGFGGSIKKTFLTNALDNFIERVAPCPWTTTMSACASPASPKPLYTSEQRKRRDATRWTLVQGVLAPLQFAIFLVSLGLVLNYLWSGNGYTAAAISIVAKTMALYLIMITGAIWEKEVFGRYLFAPSFFWEDAVSMIVIALHTLYLAAFAFDWSTGRARMILALAAYAFYALNATQFVLKFRSARLESPQGVRLAGGTG